jgi:ATP-dependent Clp protease ATP-binding subunit ClpB
MIDSLQLSDETKEAINIAQSLAKEYKNSNFSGSHLLKALLHENIGLTPLIDTLDKDIFYLRDWADFDMENYPKSTSIVAEPAGDDSIRKIFEQADIVRVKLSKDTIDPVCLFLAILQPGNAFTSERLKTLPITHKEVLDAILEKSSINQAISQPDKLDKEIKKAILKYCTDKTALAKEGSLDPVIGRDREIQMVFEILGRRIKNNVLIIGEPGVGKTAIVDGLAQRIVEENVPSRLKSAVILELDIKGLIAGATYKGEFEDRLKNVLKEIKTLNNAILFIDEIHALIESGGGSGPSVGDMLKPELSRGELTIIGATTTEEYRKKIEPEKALQRRFEKIMIDEPDEQTALKMLKGILPKYVDHHKLSISDQALSESIRLAKRYMKDSLLPDSAIDLIDRTLSTVYLANETSTDPKKKDRVEVEDVIAVVSQITGIPLGRLQMQEREKLLKMEDWLKSRIVGQEHAIHILSEAIRESRSGLSLPGKPIGGFFLLGPTGTGKTETAKALAALLFDDEQAMIRFDMSEFKEEHSAALLIGAPPGYVGYKEGGILVNKIREKPYSVVLFDEIEKAHNSVYDLFLQILDEGKLHDKLGKMGDFSNSVVLFTSNIGSDWLAKEIEKGNQPSVNQIQEVMGRFFRPEFLGRLTDILPFSPLKEKDVEKILDIQMKSLYKSLEEQNISLTISKEAKKYLIKEGYHPQFGARPLLGVIRNEIRRPLSKKIIAGEITAGTKVSLIVDNNQTLDWKLS